MGFIYKILNTISGKCYIGETTKENPEDRWKEHIRLIKRNTGCPALKDAMKKYGVDKFRFEILIICFDEDRYIYEKDYIKKYNSQVPNGYNILPGGEGGGFLGKHHSEAALQKIKHSLKKRYYDINERTRISLLIKKAMKKVNMREIMSKSDNYKKAVLEGRVGGKAHKDGKVSEATKQKIRESVLNYYKTSYKPTDINIEKHRQVMTNAVGRKVVQYTKDNVFIKEYNSISEAGRISTVKKSNIQRVLSGFTKTAGGFVWKYFNENILNQNDK